MSSVLTQFLIGIGWQTDDFNKGEREINRGLENVKTKITVTGAAMVGAFIGVGNQVADVAHKVNSLSLNTNTLNASTRFVNNYGLALRGLGGNAGDAVGEIKGAESALMDLRLKGEAGPFGGALQLAGVSVQPLMTAESGAEFMQELAKQMPSLTKEQRLSVQQILNLSPAGVELLSKGEAEYKKILNHVDAVAGLTPDLISNSKELNAALAETELHWEGIYNTMANGIMPTLTEMTKKATEFLSSTVKPMVEEHPMGTAAGASLIGTGAGAGALSTVLGWLGMGAAGAAAGAAAVPTAVLGAGIIASPYADKALQGNAIYDAINSATVSAVYGVTGMDISRGGVHKGENTLWDAFSNTDVASNDKAVKNYTNDFISNAQGNAFGPLGQSQKVEVQLKSSNLPPIQNNISVQLDGRAFESKVMEINERQAQGAQDDLMSTTAR